jgi:beta-phosphoglucomutase
LISLLRANGTRIRIRSDYRIGGKNAELIWWSDRRYNGYSMQQEPSAVIWDMDGVLIDSGDYHYRAWREILASERRAPLTLENFRKTFGLRNSDLLRDVLGLDLTDEAAEQLATSKEDRFSALVRESGVPLLPGVPAWLEHLHESGWRQAVASSAPRPNLEAILDVVAIRRYFDAMVTAEDVAHGKPDPEVFLTAASKLDVPPQRCIVIEDAPAGVEGARRAGMACIGVLTTHDHLEADITAPTLQDVPLARIEQLIERR